MINFNNFFASLEIIKVYRNRQKEEHKMKDIKGYEGLYAITKDGKV
jgi:hypothetical protein